jgi:uncharacterized protein
MAKKIKILAIDGGGMYGIVSAMLLHELEELTNKPISSLFDLIAGTSTGGILALGLTTPDASGKLPRYTAEEMVALYEKNGKDIFSRSFFHELVSLNNLLDKKYPSDGIETILYKYFGKVMLSETITDVLVTAYNIENRDAYFFKSHKARRDAERNFYLRDIAHATSAAPTYFEPVKITNEKKSQEFVLVDGGVFANNPTMCAYAEVKKYHPEVEEIEIISVGSSGAREPYRYEQVKHWGAAAWIVPALQIIQSGVQDTVDYQLKQIFSTQSEKKGTYTRLQPVTVSKIQMDDVHEDSIRLLKEFAGKYIENNRELLESVAQQLVTKD